MTWPDLHVLIWMQICDGYTEKIHAGGNFGTKLATEVISEDLIFKIFPGVMPQIPLAAAW